MPRRHLQKESTWSQTSKSYSNNSSSDSNGSYTSEKEAPTATGKSYWSPIFVKVTKIGRSLLRKQRVDRHTDTHTHEHNVHTQHYNNTTFCISAASTWAANWPSSMQTQCEDLDHPTHTTPSACRHSCKHNQTTSTTNILSTTINRHDAMLHQWQQGLTDVDIYQWPVVTITHRKSSSYTNSRQNVSAHHFLMDLILNLTCMQGKCHDHDIRLISRKKSFHCWHRVVPGWHVWLSHRDYCGRDVKHPDSLL